MNRDKPAIRTSVHTHRQHRGRGPALGPPGEEGEHDQVEQRAVSSCERFAGRRHPRDREVAERRVGREAHRRDPRGHRDVAGRGRPRSATSRDPEQRRAARTRRRPMRQGVAGLVGRPDDEQGDRSQAAPTVAGAARNGAVSLAVICRRTIITGVEDSAELIGFYERAYSHSGPEADRYGRWRALSAVGIGKADHVVALCGRTGVVPASTLDVGCRDGALLCELRRRSFGGTLSGLEISEPAAEIARRALPDAELGTFDGVSLPLPDGSRELGNPLARPRARSRPARAAGGGRARLRRGRVRGAARGQRVGAARVQARARRGDRPPPAALTRVGAPNRLRRRAGPRRGAGGSSPR